MRITILKAGNHTTYHLNPNSVVGVRTIDVLNSLYYYLDTTGGGAFEIDRESYDRIVEWMESNLWVHHKPPTVEDVLNELCTKAFHSRQPDAHVRYKDVIAEYAKRLQLKEE